MNKLFEAVPTGTRPDTEGWIGAITKDGKHVSYLYTGTTMSFIAMRDQYTHWLKPIAPTKEAADRAKELYPDPECAVDVVVELVAVDRERAAHLKGWQEGYGVALVKEILLEASTGQAGDLWNKLYEAAKKLIETVSLRKRLTMREQQNIFGLSYALDKYSLSLSSTPSHTVEDDWVRVEDGLPELGRDVISFSESEGMKFTNYKTHSPECQSYREGDTGGHFMWVTHNNYLKEHRKVTHWKYAPLLPDQSPTPTTDKVEEEIKRHSDTWDAAYRSYERNSQVAYSVEQDGMYVWTDLEESNIEKDQYIQSLENKLRNS